MSKLGSLLIGVGTGAATAYVAKNRANARGAKGVDEEKLAASQSTSAGEDYQPGDVSTATMTDEEKEKRNLQMADGGMVEAPPKPKEDKTKRRKKIDEQIDEATKLYADGGKVGASQRDVRRSDKYPTSRMSGNERERLMLEDRLPAKSGQNDYRMGHGQLEQSSRDVLRGDAASKIDFKDGSYREIEEQGKRIQKGAEMFENYEHQYADGGVIKGYSGGGYLIPGDLPGSYEGSAYKINTSPNPETGMAGTAGCTARDFGKK